jgi:hypothetical protein
VTGGLHLRDGGVGLTLDPLNGVRAGLLTLLLAAARSAGCFLMYPESLKFVRLVESFLLLFGRLKPTGNVCGAWMANPFFADLAGSRRGVVRRKPQKGSHGRAVRVATHRPPTPGPDRRGIRTQGPWPAGK